MCVYYIITHLVQKGKMRIIEEVKLDFNDVLIKPKRSTLISRKDARRVGPEGGDASGGNPAGGECRRRVDDRFGGDPGGGRPLAQVHDVEIQVRSSRPVRFGLGRER